MIKIHYVQPSGAHHAIEADVGQSIMEVAIANNVPGIDADCGGQCACGTCHVHIDERWLTALPEPGPEEVEMLTFAAGSGSDSRLACQVRLQPSHDGIVVRLPEGQH